MPDMTIADIAAMPWFCELPPDENIGWRNVSQTQLSIARHFGGTNVNGHHYTYMPVADVLIRSDILKRAERWLRTHKAPAEPGPEQMELL